MKTCTFAGCHSPQFGGSYCAYHQYIRRMKGGDLFKPKPRQRKPIPKESKKRKEEKKYYSQHCKELEQEIREQNNGKIYCFFSGEEITEFVTWHHLRGRTGKFYLDKEFLVPSINENHLMNHYASYGDITQQPWYEGYLERLKAKDILSYKKELKRKEKSESDLDITD